MALLINDLEPHNLDVWSRVFPVYNFSDKKDKFSLIMPLVGPSSHLHCQVYKVKVVLALVLLPPADVLHHPAPLAVHDRGPQLGHGLINAGQNVSAQNVTGQNISVLSVVEPQLSRRLDRTGNARINCRANRAIRKEGN